jgi:hypothetical protein
MVVALALLLLAVVPRMIGSIVILLPELRVGVAIALVIIALVAVVVVVVVVVKVVPTSSSSFACS